MKKLLITLLTFIMLLCSFGLVACKECKHENTQKSTTIEATCTQTGLEKTTCKDCGEILEEKTLSKLSHTASDWITDSEANCKNAGLRHKKCSDCESILEIDIVSDLFEHNYVYGECEICGAIDSNYMTKGLVFALINNDTEYAIVGYVGEETEVIIPDIYRGKPVTGIGDWAFCDSLLTSIEIPNSVTSIGDWAFSSCTSLTNAIIGNSVTSIGEYAFSNCDLLTSVVMSNSVTSIGELAFYNCDLLTSIFIPNSVTSIGNYAFHDCESLTIYCEASEKPSGWDNDWNYSNRPVEWGYTGNN